jgi:hypothetical protein
MMVTVEPRVAERRRGVSEDKARHRLRWILGIIVVITIGVIGFWLVRSPLLSISSISISGAVLSHPEELIEDIGIGVGVPTIDIDAGAIERVVEADPWISSVEVSVRWPGTVDIAVIEHVAVTSARAGGGWVVLSRETTVLEPADDPVAGTFLVDIDTSPTPIGQHVDDPMVEGAIAFGSALAPDLATDAVVTVDDGGLVANVGGHIVRLGRPIDLEEKALVLGSLLATGLAEDAVINLIAPTRPAVFNARSEVTDPQPEVEDEE